MAKTINKQTRTKSQSSSAKPVVVAVSGYFNPLHVGHLEMIEKAKKLGDKLVVIVNSDRQVKIKGSVPFMSQADRVQRPKRVDEFSYHYTDHTVCRSLAKVKPNIFANGGDRKSLMMFRVCYLPRARITMVDGRQRLGLAR